MAARHALLLSLLVGCAGASEASIPGARRERPEPPRSAHRVVPIELTPLDGPPIEPLDLGGGVEAFVARPVGAREPRRIVVGVHGAGDRADWSCTEWAATMRRTTWVVCPKGVPSQWQGFESWGSAEMIADRADRAVALVRDRFGAYVANEPLVYGGWSQGATLASSVIASRPGVYGLAVLVEAGYTPLDEHAVARDLLSGGVSRVVVSCSSVQCRDFSARLDRARPRRLAMWRNDVGLRGHRFDEPVFDSLGEMLREVDEAGPKTNVARP